MKKHFKAYVNNFEGATEVREKLMACENANQVEVVVKEFLAML
jgi:tRNA-dihydrouridine synthase